MRSAASHFSGLIRVVVFLVVVGLLVYTVVHWAHNRQKQPVATAPSQSQTSSQDNNSPLSNKNDNGKSTSSSSSNKNTTSSDNSNTPTKIAGDNSVTKPNNTSATRSQTQTTAVPSTGLGLSQAIIGALGVSATVYAGYTYSKSRHWLNLD